VRPLRGLLIFKLGVWVGLAAAAAVVKRAVPSLGDEDSDELALAAVFDGIELASHAKAFRGGGLLAWFGGIDLDLREAQLAPGAQLSVHTLFGGVNIKTPTGWRVESNVKTVMGGVDARQAESPEPDAPVLKLEGAAVFGGVAVSAG